MGPFNTALARSRLFVGTSLLSSLLLLPATVHAADASVADVAEADEAGGDIVVTAQRREQSTMDVGINVTSISNERLQLERVERIGELKQLTSNVEVREIRPGGGQPVITIRGVGMNDFTVASNPSTSVYFDGVYSPNIGTISQQFFDLQSVEVLKGPQSTLYGRNATAGAVTVSSAQPTDTLSGYLTGGIGNYNAIEAEGAVGGPIAQGLTARLAVRTRQMYDGWIKNLYPGGHDIGEVHQVALRAQLKWEASDRLTLRGIFSYQHEDDEPGAFTAFGRHVPGGSPTVSTPFCPVALANRIDFGNTCASLFGAQRTSTDVRTISENDPWTVKGEAYTGTLIATWRGDSFAVTSTTGYLHWQEQYIKSDALPITEQTAILDQRTWQWSQDLQIASTGTRTLEWMGGVYLSTANTNNPTYTIAPIQKANFIAVNSADTRTVQAYAQFDWNVTPKLQLTAGARYIHEFNSKFGGTWKDVDQDRTISAGDVNQAFLDDSITQDAVSWKIGVNYKPSRNTLIYGSITHGFKSGGFIAPAVATNSTQLLPYKGEHLYAFEIGWKQNLWDNLVSFTTSLFYYKYNDMQTNQQELVGNLLVNRFANLPHAHIKGMDFELAVRPVRGMELRFDGGLIDSWVGAFTSGGVNFAAGNRFANAPTFTGSASARYRWALTDDFDMSLSASVHRQSSVFTNTENTPLYRIDSDATLVNAQLQLIMPDKGWTASAWVKNLTNDEYTNSTFQNGSAVNTVYNMPRTYGLSITRKF